MMDARPCTKDHNLLSISGYMNVYNCAAVGFDLADDGFCRLAETFFGQFFIRLNYVRGTVVHKEMIDWTDIFE